MSWSVSGVGKGPALGKKLAADFGNMARMHPAEEAAKDAAAALIAHVTSTQTSPNPVRITASGSIALNSIAGHAGQESQVSHSFSMTVETLWGFVE